MNKKLVISIAYATVFVAYGFIFAIGYAGAAGWLQ